jgi:hypothetical protein
VRLEGARVVSGEMRTQAEQIAGCKEFPDEP